MKSPRRAVPAGVVVFLVILSVVRSGAASPNTYLLSGRVLGASKKNVVYVALWQADGFLKRPVQQIRIEPRAELVFRFEVPAGRWALSAFEDRNGDGILDMGLFGPKEASGFWRGFTGWHKPGFDEVASFIEHDIPNADIRIK